MTVLRQYNPATSQWEIIFTGATGDDGFVAQNEPPTNTNQLWLDLDDPALDAIPSTIIDAKGDLLVGSAPDTIIRLAVGTNGQALVADSTQTGGVRWGNVTSSGEDDQIVIATRMFS